VRALCYLLCGLFLAPFAALAWTALSTLDLAAWSLHALALKSVLRALACGLVAALTATAAGAALAYQVCFHRFPLRRLLSRALVLPLLFPAFVLGTIYRELLAASGLLAQAGLLPAALAVDVATTAGFVFVMAVGLFPYAYLLCRISFESHGLDFLELGQSLGLSFTGAFTRILLPLTLPAMLLGAGLVFVETAGEWATAELLSVETSAVAIHELWIARGLPHLASQLAFLFVAIALLLLVPITRWLGRLNARYLAAVPDTAPRPPRQPATSGWGWLRLSLCSLPLLLGFAIPAATVGVLLARTIGVIDLSALAKSCVGSVALLVAVATISLGFSLLLVVTQRAAPGLATSLFLRWLGISYMVPATVLAVGSLILADQVLPAVERYGELTSFLILAGTLSVRFTCFLLVPMFVGLGFLSRRLGELGATLGLGEGPTFLRLQLPQIRVFALLGLLLLVIQTLKETAISTVLRPFSFQTLALRTYAYIDIDLLPESAAWIAATALLGRYPLLTLEGLLSRRDGVGR